MKLDSAIKDLQKEKTQLETQLKQVNVALAAIIKLGKPEKESLEAKAQAT
jgi:hypothetical protein